MAEAQFQPRQHPHLVALLERILERIHAELRGAVGIAVTVHDRRHHTSPSLIAARGIGADIVEAQLSGLGGPVADSLRHEVPVLSPDLWTDDRWPELTLAAMTAHLPGHRDLLERLRGAAAVPGFWRDDATVVVSCSLAEPADAATVNTLFNYEQLLSAALVTTAAENAAVFEDLLGVLQSRGAIEQAKGALMGLVGCDADQAWSMLRRASQEFNVKLRELAVALLEHVSGAPAEQPDTAAPIAPNAPARAAARLLWTAMAKSERKPP